MKTCPVCDTAYPTERTTCPTDGAVLIESHEFAVGRIVRGKYRILRKLGQGGMGVVYQAEHQMLGGQVALKFLATELSRNPQFVKRFRNEARAAYQLRHPNIVEVADLDQDEEGSLFIAMEYVAGPSLRALMREAKGPLPTDRALGIARGVAAGLAAAHARGAIHRDIKPENILLAVDAENRIQAKVLDFGIAAMTDNITDLSRTHGLLLTPEYASPEQWRGTPAAELDGRTDLYALGGCLYEMLAGRTPYKAVNPEGWMYQHLHGTMEPLSTLRPDLAAEYPGLDAVVMGLLARDREQRIPSALTFLEVVAGWAPQSLGNYAQSTGLPYVRMGGTEGLATGVRSGPQRPGTPSGPQIVSASSAAQEATGTPETQPVSASSGSQGVNAPSTDRWGGPTAGQILGSTTGQQAAATTGQGGNLQGATTGAGQTNAVSITTMQLSHKHSLLLIAGGVVLAGVVAFLVAWQVFRQPPALPAAEIPKLFPPGGRYNAPQTIIITDATPNATIHYTMDGTPPNSTSPVYTQPLDSLPNGATLRAVATADGHKQSPSIIGFYTWPDAGSSGTPTQTQTQGQPSTQAQTQTADHTQTQPPAHAPATPDVFAQGKSAYDHKEFVQARSFFSQACDKGNLDGCNYLGYLLSQGLGGAPDVTSARGIFTKACDGGNVSSCVSLGSLFQNAGDATNARKYFQMACSRGSAQACTLAREAQ